VRSFETVRFVVGFASGPRAIAPLDDVCRLQGPSGYAIDLQSSSWFLNRGKMMHHPFPKFARHRCARHKADPSPVARAASGPRNISRPRCTDAAAHAVILWSIVAHSRCCDAHMRDTRIAASFTRHNFSHTHIHVVCWHTPARVEAAPAGRSGLLTSGLIWTVSGQHSIIWLPVSLAQLTFVHAVG